MHWEYCLGLAIGLNLVNTSEKKGTQVRRSAAPFTTAFSCLIVVAGIISFCFTACKQRSTTATTKDVSSQDDSDDVAIIEDFFLNIETVFDRIYAGESSGTLGGYALQEGDTPVSVADELDAFRNDKNFKAFNNIGQITELVKSLSEHIKFIRGQLENKNSTYHKNINSKIADLIAKDPEKGKMVKEKQIKYEATLVPNLGKAEVLITELSKVTDALSVNPRFTRLAQIALNALALKKPELRAKISRAYLALSHLDFKLNLIQNTISSEEYIEEQAAAALGFVDKQATITADYVSGLYDYVQKAVVK